MLENKIEIILCPKNHKVKKVNEDYYCKRCRKKYSSREINYAQAEPFD